MEQVSLQSALNKALEMEEKGYRFYKDTAKKIENDITKKTFDFLAQNEILHLETIKEFCKALEEKGEFPDLGLEDVRVRRAKDLSIFSKDISELNEKVKPSDTDKEACEFAIEFENSGYAYYKNMLKEARDERLKKLLKFLLEEEGKHCESIIKLHSFITDSANWFMYEEDSFPQGG